MEDHPESYPEIRNENLSKEILNLYQTEKSKKIFLKIFRLGFTTNHQKESI